MNKIKLILILAIFALAGCEKETVIKENDLPAEIKTFITTHFPANPIIQSVKDRDGLELTYDVILEGNISLEFNRKKQITDVDGIAKLPDSLIPSSILNYVSTNYSGNVITGWELDDRNQQITLDNGLELEFSMPGVFLRIDS
ncbi:PepSY-like domain-containing protein [Agriterribacter sp.]|uniref:PepSY-like domain-containing protein n=1 Tax=Agriterribacter sp. TaxID=2821509 RepID=UPI002B91F9FD|nr:PepSY-like domain-containing protein [Agriterribacter sp.]HRP55056.1 PepSY-like domain-containing protein [Agriterribacter sp.]